MKRSNSLYGTFAAATLVIGSASAYAESFNQTKDKPLLAAAGSMLLADNINDDYTTARSDAAEPAVGGEGDNAIGGNAPNPEPDRSAETVIDDARITAEIKTKLLADPMVSGLKIDVDTRSGVVYLTGDNMNSQDVINQAMRLAQGVDGVRTVESKMTIGDVTN
jgi:hyperosmotically inducible periplasmic protein